MPALQKLVTIAIVLCCCATYTESSADGWTDPTEPIIQEIGSEVRIKCGVNGEKYSNRELWFYNGSEPIHEQYISKIGNKVIEMRMQNVAEQESVITCKLNGQHGISYNDIKIGRKPEDITGLKCISPNWHDMNCTFEKPYNPVVVQYSMTYRIPGSSQLYRCAAPAIKDPKIFWCHIANYAYRKATPELEFFLNGTNNLGKNSQAIIVDNFASVIPDKPDSFKDIKIMSDGVILQWVVSGNLLVFPKPFDYEISITSPTECDPKMQNLRFPNESFTVNSNPRNFTKTIPLKFANTWYDIGFRMRISSAPDVEEMWSKWVKSQVKTRMRRPDNPPAIDKGSFNIGPGGDVYIYWKHLPKCYQNGGEYGYTVSSSDSKNDAPNEILPHLAIYTKDRINLMKDTTITIRNHNQEGVSKNVSMLTIPGNERRLDGPTKIKKILSNGSYQLSWSPPDHLHETITSYTVFWCVSKSELPNSCEGSINFERRLPLQTHFNFESNQTVNFAVSANSETSTSGMVWARCTTANSNEIGKIKTIWIPRLASKEIEVEWKLECTDSGIVAGYQLEYCPSEKPRTLECKETAKKLNITGGLDNPKHTLTNLSPYTTYKIIIRMFSNSTMGPASDPLANTTLEAAPSEVRALIARNIGNTSVELYWDPPQFSNGVLLFYKVWANGKDHKVSDRDDTVEIDNGQITRMNYTLKGLMAYTDYDIAVEACTKECSTPMKTKIKTTVGLPGDFRRQPKIQTFRNNLMNKTTGNLEWEEPVFRGGELDYYEFKRTLKQSDGSFKDHIVKTRKMKCYVDNLCASNTFMEEFSVRAVNFVLTPHSKVSRPEIRGSDDDQSCDKDDYELLNSLKALKLADPHGWYLPGPWSPAVGHSCSPQHATTLQVFMLMATMVASLLIIGMVYFSYKKIKDMKDILVQMPPGLEDLTGDKLKKAKDLNAHMDKMGTPDILRNVDNMSINCEDENGQLLKKSLNGSLHGGDCSSSMHSDSTRSEMDHENDDEIEYGEFGQDNRKGKRVNDGLQSFIINPMTGEEIPPILITPEVLSTSTPIADKCPKPNIILNPKMSMPPQPSNGYVSQPMPKVISPASPVNSNGYVTHSMFNPMQSSGYTPLSAFGKPIASQSSALEDKLNLKTPIVATTDQEGISGYVTHRQLSDFGHRMQ